MKPDRAYQLDLSLRDHRVVAEILVHLAVSSLCGARSCAKIHPHVACQVVEPGENWEDETYNNIQGWELPATWGTSVPSEGHLFLRYTTTGPGCKPNWPERRQLVDFVLADMSEQEKQAVEIEFLQSRR